MSIKKYKFKTIKNEPTSCIDCSVCTKNCELLDKYSMNLKEFWQKDGVENECNLCNQCYNVCPKDISGADIAINHKKTKFSLKKSWLKFQKSPYIFANNSAKKCGDLIFFGCNFVGYYPKTTKFIIDNICGENIDFSIDCCGKPLFEAGIKLNNSLSQKHAKKGVRRLVTACPNCYHFLKPRLDIEVISIYQKLKELDIIKNIESEAHLFFPCPERNNRAMFEDFKDFLPNYKESFLDINCCGAGGDGGDKNISKNYSNKLKSKNKPNLYLYCATCAGKFASSGIKNIHHLTSDFLGVNEVVSNKYLQNVIRFKYYKKDRV